MYIIVGLGNPGSKYSHTRHNAGFDAIDELADQCGIAIETKKFHGLCGSGVIDGQKVLLLKPQTFMNASGEAVRAACEFYKIDPEEELIVLYDDISLPPGQLRIRKKGSAGGHNGIKSIIAHMGTQVFKRIKIGVGDKPEQYDLVDHVLGHFSRADRLEMLDAFDRAAKAAAMLLTHEPEYVMNEFNTRKAAE